MKVNIINEHPFYGKGVVEVSDERGGYLIRIGVAEDVKEKKEFKATTEKVEVKKSTEKKAK